MSTYDFEPDPRDYGPEPAHIANGKALVKPLFVPKRASDDFEAKCEELAQAHKANEALLATNRALELDAKRYRWLRKTTNTVTNSSGERIDVRNMPDEWDAAIDSAMGAQA